MIDNANLNQCNAILFKIKLLNEENYNLLIAKKINSVIETSIFDRTQSFF